MSKRISVLLAALAALAVVIGFAATPASPTTPASPAPKLKEVGLILVDYVPSKSPGPDGLVALWHTGLNFKNAPLVHAAVCVYDPAHDDFHVGGLHLTPGAARQLAGNLIRASGTHSAGGVEIANHRNHLRNIWVTLRPQAATALAGQITAAARGH